MEIIKDHDEVDALKHDQEALRQQLRNIKQANRHPPERRVSGAPGDGGLEKRTD
jgi:hypothetical protein